MFPGALGIIVIGAFLSSTPTAVQIDGEVRIGATPGLSKPATVQLLRERLIVYEQFTDLNGRFEFQGVEPSRYIVRAKYDDLPETEVEVYANAGGTRFRVPITIRPPKHSPIGRTETISVDQLRTSEAARNEYQHGLKFRKAGDCKRATVHLRKAIDLAPRYGEAFNELGNCLVLQQNSVEAEAAFIKAIEYKATIYPSINLADLYVSQGRYEDASAVITQAIAQNSGEGDLFFALARIHYDRGRMSDAEAAALEAHRRTHRTADVHLLLSKIYLALENRPALISQLETYLVENPSGKIAEQVRQNLKALPRPR